MIKRKTVTNKQQIISEYLSGDDTFKTLSVKYGVNKHTIQTWARAFRLNHTSEVELPTGAGVPQDHSCL